MFEHKAHPTRIWQFPAREALTNADVVSDHIWLAHRYRNDLVALERQRRERLRQVISEHFPAVFPLEEEEQSLLDQIAAAEDAVNAAKIIARSRTAGDKGQREQLECLRGELRCVRGQLRLARAEAYATVTVTDDSGEERTVLACPDMQAVEDETHASALALREAFAGGWGTYLSVEAGLKGMRSGPPPRFHRWRRDGKIAVQCQGGMTLEEACSPVTENQGQLHIEFTDNLHMGRERKRYYQPEGRVNKRPTMPLLGSRRQQKMRQAVVWLRIGTQRITVTGKNGKPRERNAPLWAKVPCIIDRQIPDDARIQWVYLHRRRIGYYDYWHLSFFLARDAWEVPACGTLRAGIDVGWRLLSSGNLRVAYLVGSDGYRESLEIPEARLAQWRRCEEIHSQRDLAFNAMRDDLVSYRDANTLPDWLLERMAYLGQWRSPERLVSLAWSWRSRRADYFEGLDMLDRLESWRLAEYRLAEEEAHIRDRCQQWRKDFYRNTIARWRKKYGTVAIENRFVEKFCRLPACEDPAWINQQARWHTRIASCGMLHSFIRAGIPDSRPFNPALTTRRCPHCGHVNDTVDFARSAVVTCRNCTRKWDQDFGAGQNLLRMLPSPEAAEAVVA